jgi:hypothetical protein
MNKDKKKSPAQQGIGIMKFLRKLFGKRKEKHYVLKQYSITISGFTTQLEAYRMADSIQKTFGIPPEMITISEADLLISQAEYEQHQGKNL